MVFRKQALPVALAFAMFGVLGSAAAQEGGPVVIEVFVDQDGNTEVVCPTTQCNAGCRDLEGTQILLQDTFYRIGSNCSITITDGAQLQDAIEAVFAFLADVIPEAPPPPGGDITQVEEELQNTESNPNQNTPNVVSPNN